MVEQFRSGGALPIVEELTVDVMGCRAGALRPLKTRALAAAAFGSHKKQLGRSQATSQRQQPLLKTLSCQALLERTHSSDGGPPAEPQP